MRQAILADICGNLIALEAVLKDCAEWRVDQIVCLGGTIGFGPDGVECVDRLREVCAWSLCGMRDLMITERPDWKLNKKAQTSLDREMKRLKAGLLRATKARERMEWLKGLKPSRCENNVLYVYGSPRDPICEFLVAEDFYDIQNLSIKATDAFAGDFEICFFAHTHRPGVVTRERGWLNPSALRDGIWVLNDNTKTLVNVGSVGQPRDRDPRSCYVIWDDRERAVSFHRVPYDLDAVHERFKRVPELSELLFLRLKEGQ